MSISYLLCIRWTTKLVPVNCEEIPHIRNQSPTSPPIHPAAQHKGHQWTHLVLDVLGRKRNRVANNTILVCRRRRVAGHHGSGEEMHCDVRDGGVGL